MVYFLLGAMIMGMVILAVPLSLGYNSREKWLQVRWFGVTVTRVLGKEKSEESPRKTPDKGNGFRSAAAWRLLQNRDLVWELMGKLMRFAWEVCRTLTFRDSEASFSLPDPRWNGMLYGVITNLDLREVNLSVNFEQRNYAKIWVTVYPYRVLQKVAVFLLRFPYLRTIRLAWDLRKQRQTH